MWLIKQLQLKQNIFLFFSHFKWDQKLNLLQQTKEDTWFYFSKRISKGLISKQNNIKKKSYNPEVANS